MGMTDPNGWRPVAEADGSDCIVSDGIGWAAIAYRRGGEWFMGNSTDEDTTDLEFEPLWWLPRRHPTNPFRAPFPDGRPTMAERARWTAPPAQEGRA